MLFAIIRLKYTGQREEEKNLRIKTWEIDAIQHIIMRLTVINNVNNVNGDREGEQHQKLKVFFFFAWNANQWVFTSFTDQFYVRHSIFLSFSFLLLLFDIHMLSHTRNPIDNTLIISHSGILFARQLSPKYAIVPARILRLPSTL